MNDEAKAGALGLRQGAAARAARRAAPHRRGGGEGEPHDHRLGDAGHPVGHPHLYRFCAGKPLYPPAAGPEPGVYHQRPPGGGGQGDTLPLRHQKRAGAGQNSRRRSHPGGAGGHLRPGHPGAAPDPGVPGGVPPAPGARRHRPKVYPPLLPPGGGQRLLRRQPRKTVLPSIPRM